MTDRDHPAETDRSHLRRFRFSGRLAWLALLGTALSILGLLLLTGFAGSPWLYLLYPVLFGLLIASLLVLAFQLLHRL